MYNIFEGERAPKKRSILVKLSKQCLKTPFTVSVFLNFAYRGWQNVRYFVENPRSSPKF